MTVTPPPRAPASGCCDFLRAASLRNLLAGRFCGCCGACCCCCRRRCRCCCCCWPSSDGTGCFFGAAPRKPGRRPGCAGAGGCGGASGCCGGCATLRGCEKRRRAASAGPSPRTSSATASSQAVLHWGIRMRGSLARKVRARVSLLCAAPFHVTTYHAISSSESWMRSAPAVGGLVQLAAKLAGGSARQRFHAHRAAAEAGERPLLRHLQTHNFSRFRGCGHRLFGK